MERLSDETRETLLAPLFATGWAMVEGRDAIRKEFKFSNFATAFGWMTSAAIWAEKWNHHPEWSNIYNRVTVDLTTHDVDGLSTLDIKYARKLDLLAGHTEVKQ